MCSEPGSSPPVPADPGVPTRSERVTLTAADGNRLAAWSSAPAAGSDGPAVLVLPDIRGLSDFYTELGTRFAEAGHPAAVIDYYGRTAADDDRGAGFPAMRHASQLRPAQLHADLVAGVRHLKEGGSDAVVTLGFCLGGRLAVLATAGPEHLAGAVGFYCWPARGPDGAPGPTARAAELRAPVLALMAGEDPGIPVSDVEEFRAALAATGGDHEVVLYPGAPHSFFDVTQAEHRAESADAWHRVLTFLDRLRT